MKKLLILLSTYNGEKYLSELLDSVFNQTYKSIDLLVRDDGSTDDTLFLLKKYSEKYSIRIIEGKNIGAAESFFDLIKSADNTYKYYAFCDQDDVWLPEKIEAAVSKLEEVKNDCPNLYYSGQILVDDKLNKISNHHLDNTRSYKANFIFNQMAGCTAVLNNALFRLLKAYKPNNVYMHDAWCYKVCVTCNGNVIVDDKEYILYRQHGNNTVGLSKSIHGKMSLLKSHLNNSPSSYARELLEGYDKDIEKSWIPFLRNLVNKGIVNRWKLATDKEICFHSVYLKTIFIIKLLVGYY